MNVSLLLARRMHLRKGSEGGTTPPGIIIAVAGIAIALVVMMLSIAIVTGFKQQIRDKITGFESQISVRADLMAQVPPEYDSDQIIDMLSSGEFQEPDDKVQLTEQLRDIMAEHLPEGVSIHLAADRTVILKTDDSFIGLQLRSLPADPQFLASNIVEGDLPTDTLSGIIISRNTASRLGLATGDKVFVHLFADGAIRTRRMPVSAIYDTRLSDFDSRLAFTSLQYMQRIGKLADDEGTAIEITGITDQALIDPMADRLRGVLNIAAAHGDIPKLTVASVHQTGATYFNWLSLLDTNVTVILILMAFVSGFTLVSSTFIIILDRVATIGILKTMGMTDMAIRRIFIYVALRLVALGLLIGNAVALTLLLLQKHFEIIPLDPESYYLSAVPVDINWLYILILNVAVIVISTLVLLIPTQAICRMRPSESIKYE